MKFFKPITLLLLLVSFSCSFAAVTPPADPSPKWNVSKIKVKDFEKFTGKKLTLLQKIELKFLQKRLGKSGDNEMTGRQREQAQASLFLGIGSLLLLLFSSVLGAVSILCIPAAILAIIFGAKSLKGNSNAKGIIGIVTGGVTIVFIILAVILVAIFFAAFTIG